MSNICMYCQLSTYQDIICQIPTNYEAHCIPRRPEGRILLVLRVVHHVRRDFLVNAPNLKRDNQIVLNFGGYLGGGERMNPIDLGSGESVCSHLVHHKCIPCTDFLVNALTPKRITRWLSNLVDTLGVISGWNLLIWDPVPAFVHIQLIINVSPTSASSVWTL